MERRSDPALQPRHGDSLGAIKETALTGIRCSMHIYVYDMYRNTHYKYSAKPAKAIFERQKISATFNCGLLARAFTVDAVAFSAFLAPHLPSSVHFARLRISRSFHAAFHLFIG